MVEKFSWDANHSQPRVWILEFPCGAPPVTEDKRKISV
jgi:hypothetical protein